VPHPRGRGSEAARWSIVGDDGSEDSYVIAASRIEVTDGQEIRAGDAIVEGPRDPKELLEIKGIRETQQYLVNEVQKVYRDQGVSIHDKHIEVIVRQMTRRVGVQEPGDSTFLPGERVDARVYRETNKALVQAGKVAAEGRPELMGITKASLATDSWLSAASFQETTRVLTEAAIESKSDGLLGLKENIIIGKLIPGRHRA
jgi:DNA-directed RNA polymerase subunit beta'